MTSDPLRSYCDPRHGNHRKITRRGVNVLLTESTVTHSTVRNPSYRCQACLENGEDGIRAHGSSKHVRIHILRLWTVARHTTTSLQGYCVDPEDIWMQCICKAWNETWLSSIYGVSNGVSQYAYLCVLSSTCVLVDSWNVISLSPSTCSNSKFASRKARSKCPDVTWSSHFPEDVSEETCAYSGQHISQNAFHQELETVAEEKINYWQLTFYKYYCCWVTECNFRMFCLFDCKK